jgi:nuclear transport factor 2 (NTF2) superfamily protein
LEDWTFAEDGKMRKRQMSGNDVEVEESCKSCACVRYNASANFLDSSMVQRWCGREQGGYQ